MLMWKIKTVFDVVKRSIPCIVVVLFGAVESLPGLVELFSDSALPVG